MGETEKGHEERGRGDSVVVCSVFVLVGAAAGVALWWAAGRFTDIHSTGQALLFLPSCAFVIAWTAAMAGGPRGTAGALTAVAVFVARAGWSVSRDSGELAVTTLLPICVSACAAAIVAVPVARRGKGSWGFAAPSAGAVGAACTLAVATAVAAADLRGVAAFVEGAGVAEQGDVVVVNQYGRAVWRVATPEFGVDEIAFSPGRQAVYVRKGSAILESRGGLWQPTGAPPRVAAFEWSRPLDDGRLREFGIGGPAAAGARLGFWPQWTSWWPDRRGLVCLGASGEAAFLGGEIGRKSRGKPLPTRLAAPSAEWVAKDALIAVQRSDARQELCRLSVTAERAEALSLARERIRLLAVSPDVHLAACVTPQNAPQSEGRQVAGPLTLVPKEETIEVVRLDTGSIEGAYPVGAAVGRGVWIGRTRLLFERFAAAGLGADARGTLRSDQAELMLLDLRSGRCRRVCRRLLMLGLQADYPSPGAGPRGST